MNEDLNISPPLRTFPNIPLDKSQELTLTKSGNDYTCIAPFDEMVRAMYTVTPTSSISSVSIKIGDYTHETQLFYGTSKVSSCKWVICNKGRTITVSASGSVNVNSMKVYISPFE